MYLYLYIACLLYLHLLTDTGRFPVLAKKYPFHTLLLHLEYWSILGESMHLKIFSFPRGLQGTGYGVLEDRNFSQRVVSQVSGCMAIGLISQWCRQALSEMQSTDSSEELLICFLESWISYFQPSPSNTNDTDIHAHTNTFKNLLRNYYVLGSRISSLHTQSHQIIKITLWRRVLYYQQAEVLKG